MRIFVLFGPMHVPRLSESTCDCRDFTAEIVGPAVNLH